jgi:hypothetical protein
LFAHLNNKRKKLKEKKKKRREMMITLGALESLRRLPTYRLALETPLKEDIQ